MALIGDRVLLHLNDGRRVPVDPREIFYLDAEKGETLVRARSAQAIIDVRQLSELEPLFAAHGFLRIYRSFLVNLRRVREVRPRDTAGWELKLAPPVNRVLPISRSHVAEVWRAFGEPR